VLPHVGKSYGFLKFVAFSSGRQEIIFLLNILTTGYLRLSFETDETKYRTWQGACFIRTLNRKPVNQTKIMNKMKYLAAVLIAVSGLGLQQAQAHLLDPFQFTTANPIGNPADDLAYLQSHGGGSYQPTFLPATSQFLFKQNNDGTTDGNFGQYFTVTHNGTTNTWTVSWDLTGSGFTLDGVFIKDGVSSPHNLLYRFYGVSADEALKSDTPQIVTFDNPVKNISFVEFFGSPGGSVPDGGTTVMLLGTALGSLGMVRRFLKR
jgi:hypothetical protein